MASMALMLVTIWLMSEGKPYAWTFYPMIFMFFTTVAALIVHVVQASQWRFLQERLKGRHMIGNTLMGLVGIFLVVAAIILAVEGWKAFGRFRVVKAQAAPAKA